MTTSDYLEQLEQDREDLVDNLETQGITGLIGDETFTELVSEVLNISTGIDWSTIGYSDTPQSIQDGYDYALNIYNTYTPSASLNSKFKDDYNIVIFPLIDTSIATDMNYMFQNARCMLEIPLLNTSNVTSMKSMFIDCFSLKKVPQLNTSNVTTMRNMFNGCDSLTTIPQFDLSSINVSNGLQNLLTACRKLTDTSLNNLLLSLISATSYTGTKTLVYVGIASGGSYTSSRIQSLPAYQDFINAGWTIGF